MSDTLSSFLLILLLSFLFTFLVSRIPLLRIPSSIGYVLFGVLLQIGPFHLTDQETYWIDQLGDFGLLFLMFLSGLEVDVTLLRPSGWAKSKINPLLTGASIFLTTVVLSFMASFGISHFINPSIHPYMMTLLLSTTSLGIILPILEESGDLHSDYGQTLLVCALFADFFTMMLVSIFVSVHSSGDLRDFFFALAVIPFAVAVYLILSWARQFRNLRALAGDQHTRMRAIVALVAAACGLADFSGSEPILGSFLVGIIISALPLARKETLREYSHGLGYGFLVPIFFISVGLHFDLQVLHNPATWGWVPLLLLISFLVKVIPAWQLRSAFGLKRAFAAGVLLSARLSLILAAAAISVRLGVLPRVLADTILIVAILTSLFAPIFYVMITDTSADEATL